MTSLKHIWNKKTRKQRFEKLRFETRKLENFGKIKTHLGLQRQKIVRMHKTCLTSQFLRLSLARFLREGKHAISPFYWVRTRSLKNLYVYKFQFLVNQKAIPLLFSCDHALVHDKIVL